MNIWILHSNIYFQMLMFQRPDMKICDWTIPLIDAFKSEFSEKPKTNKVLCIGNGY